MFSLYSHCILGVVFTVSMDKRSNMEENVRSSGSRQKKNQKQRTMNKGFDAHSFHKGGQREATCENGIGRRTKMKQNCQKGDGAHSKGCTKMIQNEIGGRAHSFISPRLLLNGCLISSHHHVVTCLAHVQQLSYGCPAHSSFLAFHEPFSPPFLPIDF